MFLIPYYSHNNVAINFKMKTYNLIFLRNSKIVLSKKTYSDWKDIQTEFDDYMSSIDFESKEDLIEYLCADYKIDLELINSQINKLESSELEKIELTI